MERIADILEGIVDRVGRAFAWLVLVVVFLLFLQNPLREYIGRGQFLANDMAQLAHAAVFMIGVAYAWRWDRQVRVDLFYRNFSPSTRAIVNLAGTLFLLLPWLGFVASDAFPTVILSIRLWERFPETGSPGFFAFKSLLIIFIVMMGLQASAIIIRSIATIRDPSRARA